MRRTNNELGSATTPPSPSSRKGDESNDKPDHRRERRITSTIATPREKHARSVREGSLAFLDTAGMTAMSQERAYLDSVGAASPPVSAAASALS